MTNKFGSPPPSATANHRYFSPSEKHVLPMQYSSGNNNIREHMVQIMKTLVTSKKVFKPRKIMTGFAVAELNLAF